MSTPTTRSAIEQLAATVNEVSGSRGVMLVPSFAIGRTQEVVWVLDELLRDGRIPHVPLYLDSPMASRASDVYLRHPEVYDEETAALLRSGDSPLVYPGEQYTNAVDESKAIRDQPRPIMVVASSGMLTGGRIMHHLKDFLPDPLHAAVHRLPGGGDAGTAPADRRQDGAHRPRRVRGALQGRLDLRLLGPCRRQRADGLAGALRRLTTDRSSGTDAPGRPKRVYLVHGDPDATAPFAERLRRELGLDVHIPSYREVVTLG